MQSAASSPQSGREEDLEDATPRNPKFEPELRPHLFGHGAFAEAMCRIAFAYLHFFGNAQQQCMGSLGRVTWLIMYLRSGLKHIGRLRPEQFPPHPLDCPLRSLLEGMPSEKDADCPREALAVDLPLATVRHRVAPDDLMTTSKSVRRRNSLKVDKSSSQAPLSPGNRPGFQRRLSAAASPTGSRGTSPGGAQHAAPGANAPETTLVGFFPERRDSSSSSSATSSCDHSGTDDESELMHTATSRVNGQGKESMVKAMTTGVSLLGVGAADTHGKVRASRRLSRFTSVDTLPSWPLIGSDWIEGGVCGLCEAALDTTPWGRATCPGCSVVDVCRFQRHPFKPLLLDWHPDVSASKVVPHADEPTLTYQAVAPTPPMGKRAGLRGVTVTKMFAISAAFSPAGSTAPSRVLRPQVQGSALGDSQATQKSVTMPRKNTSQPK